MKLTLFCLMILAACLNLACQRPVESSPVTFVEKKNEPARKSPLLKRLEEENIDDKLQAIGRFTFWEEDQSKVLYEFEGFQIKKVVAQRSDEFGSPVTGIINAVLSKKGKQLARFKGEFNPLGNEMSFGLYTFLGGTEKQLLVSDKSPRYNHDWIVRLEPEFKVIYDNEDFKLYNGFRLIDLDHDGVSELIAGKDAGLGVSFARTYEKSVQMVFKYDPQANKYLPASHLFLEVVLDGFESAGFDEQLKNFKESKDNSLSPELLQIISKYIYAGRETEAWKFFDETDIVFDGKQSLSGEIKNKAQLKELIIKELINDPIYRFIKADLKKN